MQFSDAVADRLLSWQGTLSQSLDLQPPPPEPRPQLPLDRLSGAQVLAAFDQLSPAQLQQVTGRLMVLNRIDHIVASTERRWLALLR